MTARDVLTLALRVMGFWAIIRAVGQLGYAVAAVYYLLDRMQEAGNWSENMEAPAYLIVSGLVQPVAACCFGLLLLLFALRISGLFYGRAAASRPDPKAVPWDPTDVYRVGVQLMGIYAFLLAIPPLVKNVTWLFSRDKLRPVGAHEIAGIIEGGLYLACCVVLVYGSRNVARWLGSVRYVPETSEIEQPQTPAVPRQPDG